MDEDMEKTEQTEDIVHKSVCDKVIEKMEKSIESMIEKDITVDDLNILDKLVDIHKDMYNEKYWKVKERAMMRYDNYGNYGNYGRYDTYSRGYNDDYGRRGSDRRYRGHDYMDSMYDGYSRYEEGREQYNRGNYNAKDDTLKSLRYMLDSATDFFHMLKSEANSQEEMQMIREYAKKISEM